MRLWSVLLIAVVAAVLLAFTLGESGSAAAPQRSVEYKVIPASDLGIVGQPGDGVFDYKGATNKLNVLAKQGWRFRAVITAAGPAGVILERQQ